MNMRMLGVVMVACALGWCILVLQCCTSITDFDRFHFAAELEHDAGAEQLHDDAAAELEHDAGATTPATFAGTWKVTRTSQPSERLCTDAYGNTRDPSTTETWTVAGGKLTGTKLQSIAWRELGQTAELASASVSGSVTLTSSIKFSGSLRISANSPTPGWDGWSICTTTQLVDGVRQ